MIRYFNLNNNFNLNYRDMNYVEIFPETKYCEHETYEIQHKSCQNIYLVINFKTPFKLSFKKPQNTNIINNIYFGTRIENNLDGTLLESILFYEHYDEYQKYLMNEKFFKLIYPLKIPILKSGISFENYKLEVCYVDDLFNEYFIVHDDLLNFRNYMAKYRQKSLFKLLPRDVVNLIMNYLKIDNNNSSVKNMIKDSKIIYQTTSQKNFLVNNNNNAYFDDHSIHISQGFNNRSIKCYYSQPSVDYMIMIFDPPFKWEYDPIDYFNLAVKYNNGKVLRLTHDILKIKHKKLLTKSYFHRFENPVQVDRFELNIYSPIDSKIIIRFHFES